MLKVFGHIYSDNKDNFKEVADVLTNAGFELAYEFENSATIIKEVEDESEDTAV